MTKEEALQKIEQGDGNFQVFTEVEHTTFLNNLKDTEDFKQQIDIRIADLEKKYDDDLLSITGRKRKDSERTYDFMKREFKTLTDSEKELKSKNEELQKVVDDKSGGEALELLKSENLSLIKNHKKSKEEWDTKYTALEKAGIDLRIQHEFDRSMTGMKFKDAAIIPEDVRNAMINNAKTELAKSVDFVDNKLVFRDGEGKIMYNDLAQLLTPKEVLSNKLKSIIDAGRQQPGVEIEEGDPGVEKDKDGKLIVKPITLPDSVKTNVDLSEHLHGLGMTAGSEEYGAYYAKYRDKLKIVT